MGVCCPSGTADSVEPARGIKKKPTVNSGELSKDLLNTQVSQIGGD